MIDKESCSFATWELIKCQKAYNELQEKYDKLLAFAKECAKGEEYINSICMKHAISNVKDRINMRASDLLKEIGELKE